MSKKLLLAALLSVGALMGIASCQSQPSANAGAVATASDSEATFPIAYVRMDSVSSQYKYAQDIQASLAKDAEAHRQKLQSKGAALQKAAEDFERRARINAFVSQEAAQAEQNKVLKLQQDAQSLEAELTQKFAEKQALLLEDMSKKIQEEMKVFNNGKYKLVLTNAGVLFAEDAIDITDEFIAYLNSQYKSNEAETTPAK